MDAGRGRVAVYGDSNCLDSSHMVTNCYWLLRKILDFTSEGNKDPVLFHPSKMTAPLHKDKNQLPSRRNDVNFSTYSAVVGKDLLCHKDSRFEVWRTKGYGIQLMGRNRKLPGYPAMDVDSGLNSKANESKRQLEETLRETKWIYSREVARNKLNKTMDFLGLLNHDEVRKIIFFSFFTS